MRFDLQLNNALEFNYFLDSLLFYFQSLMYYSGKLINELLNLYAKDYQHIML